MSTHTSRGRWIGCALLLLAAAVGSVAEPLPARLAGTWKITRILSTGNTACWGEEEAKPLIGTTLTYAQHSMHWKGGDVPVNDIFTRSVTAREFLNENGGAEGHATFKELGIAAASVMEVDFQHEDMDITGATTEVPGDAVLLAGPNRIVVSACGVYFEAARVAGKR